VGEIEHGEEGVVRSIVGKEAGLFGCGFVCLQVEDEGVKARVIVTLGEGQLERGKSGVGGGFVVVAGRQEVAGIDGPD
jgi:hypothetical protein